MRGRIKPQRSTRGERAGITRVREAAALLLYEAHCCGSIWAAQPRDVDPARQGARIVLNHASFLPGDSHGDGFPIHACRLHGGNRKRRAQRSCLK